MLSIEILPLEAKNIIKKKPDYFQLRKVGSMTVFEPRIWNVFALEKLREAGEKLRQIEQSIDNLVCMQKAGVTSLTSADAARVLKVSRERMRQLKKSLGLKTPQVKLDKLIKYEKGLRDKQEKVVTKRRSWVLR